VIESRQNPLPEDQAAPGREGPLGVSRSRGRQWAAVGERFALPVVWVLTIVVFSLIEPASFPTVGNVANVFGSQEVLFVLTMAVLIPSIHGDFDLSLGSVAGLTAMVAAILNVNDHWNILLACLAGVVVAVVAGVVNGVIVVTFDNDPFIVTLGTMTALTGVTYWISHSQTVGVVSSSLTNWLFTKVLFAIPLEFYYGLVLLVVVWYFFTLTPAGQRASFVGQSRDVARLSGIRVNRMRLGAYIIGAAVAGLAGIVYLGTNGSGDPTAGGSTLLLPAYAAAFLGATSIRPGRFNAIGAAIAVYFLATGVAGLQLLGAQDYVQQLFYGLALVVAIVLSNLIRRQKTRPVARSTAETGPATETTALAD
jgi:ribose transport system permease protein